MRETKLFIAALAALSSALLFAPGRAFSDAEPSPTPYIEPLPGLSFPVTDRDELAQVIKACNVKSAGAAWQSCIDLDGDGCEDAIVTLALEPESGARWQKSVRTTHVFRGTHKGSFGGLFSTAKLWFSMNTGCVLSHAEYGDEETRKTFTLHTSDGKWRAEVRTYHYQTGPGDGTTRTNHLVKSSQDDFPVETLRADPKEFL